MKTHVMIDWLQLNCRGVISPTKLDLLIKEPYSTRIFENVYKYERAGKILYTIAFKPLSPILPADTVIIKIGNEFLYRPDLWSNVNALIEWLGIVVKGITRLDLAVDFQYFLNNLLPSNLISNFVNNKYLKNGLAQFKIIGTQKETMNFEYLRFGSGESDISAYMYNKSKELKDVKNKPWITEVWQKTFIDNTLDTWRLEFSLKSNQIHELNKVTGELERLTYQSIQNQAYLEQLYTSLVYKYFRFKHNNNTKNKTEMKDVQLFKFECVPNAIRVITDKHESGRSERIFLRKLESFNNEMRAIKNERLNSDSETYGIGKVVLNDVINLYGLGDYYKNSVVHG